MRGGARHEETDLLLLGGSAVHDARDVTRTDDEDAVAELQQHIKVFADEMTATPFSFC